MKNLLYKTSPGPVGDGIFPPLQKVAIKAIACELPACRKLPLSRLSTSDIAKIAISQIARTIQTVAMMRKEERVHRLETEIESLRKELDAKAVESLRLDDYLDTTIGQQRTEAPITLQQLESLMVTSRSLGSFFSPHPSFAGVHLLCWNGEEHTVTFDPLLFDQHPNSVRLLSFGDELFDDLLEYVEHLQRSPKPPSESFGPDASERIEILRCSTEAPLRLVASYILQDGCSRRLETYNDLKRQNCLLNPP